MKQFLEDHQLADMAVPTVQPSRHQAQLRRVLVSAVATRADKTPLLKGVLATMKKPIVLTGAGLAAMLAVAVLTFSTLPSNTVSALQLAQNSAKALENMTPQEAEYKKFYPYFADWLQQAQHAPDLRVLTYDEVVQAYPEEMGSQPSAVNQSLRVIDDPSDGSSPDIKTLQYLEFTVTYNDGFDTVSKVVVGINDHNIPEAALQHFVSGTAQPRIGG